MAHTQVQMSKEAPYSPDIKVDPVTVHGLFLVCCYTLILTYRYYSAVAPADLRMKNDKLISVPEESQQI